MRDNYNSHCFQLISTVAIRMLFLGEALTTMLVYVWCRRNPYIRYNFFGLFTFEAPYLPWILVLISILFGGSVLADLVGETQLNILCLQN